MCSIKFVLYRTFGSVVQIACCHSNIMKPSYVGIYNYIILVGFKHLTVPEWYYLRLHHTVVDKTVNLCTLWTTNSNTRLESVYLFCINKHCPLQSIQSSQHPLLMHMPHSYLWYIHAQYQDMCLIANTLYSVMYTRQSDNTNTSLRQMGYNFHFIGVHSKQEFFAAM